MAGIVKDDDYAERVIGGKPERFDAIEIQGVRSEDGVHFEVDNLNPNSFSTYVHLIDGGADCIGDFTTLVAAKRSAILLALKYGWPIHDCTYEPESEVYKASIDFVTDPAKIMCACESCDWKGAATALKPIGDCSLTPGHPSPAGRCPECDTLAYVVEQYAVLTLIGDNWENTWTEHPEGGDEHPLTYPTFEAAYKGLVEHLEALEMADMDYSITEFKIGENC